MKSALRATSGNDWQSSLPLILLSFRESYKKELGFTSSEAVFGCPLKLPIDLIGSYPDPGSLNPSSCADNLRILMRSMNPPVTRPPSSASHVDPKLLITSHVFVRDNAKKGLLPYYKGPYRVIEKTDK